MNIHKTQEVIAGLEILIEKFRRAEREEYQLTAEEELLGAEISGFVSGYQAGWKKAHDLK